MSRNPFHSAALAVVAIGCLSVAPARSAPDETRTNYFHDPFVQVTRGVKDCPEPEGPLYTETEARAQGHIRIEKGTTCHYYGRCRLPNAYLYDPDIVARVALFIERDGRFDASSIWLVGQRRWVYLQGCVPSREMADALVQQVGLIDDVEKVIDQLRVGVGGAPPYPMRSASAPQPR
jgi:hypothetical protein